MLQVALNIRSVCLVHRTRALKRQNRVGSAFIGKHHHKDKGGQECMKWFGSRHANQAALAFGRVLPCVHSNNNTRRDKAVDIAELVSHVPIDVAHNDRHSRAHHVMNTRRKDSRTTSVIELVEHASIVLGWAVRGDATAISDGERFAQRQKHRLVLQIVDLLERGNDRSIVEAVHVQSFIWVGCPTTGWGLHGLILPWGL